MQTFTGFVDNALHLRFVLSKKRQQSVATKRLTYRIFVHVGRLAV